MECLIMVGLWCAHPDYNCRPSIQEAIDVLDSKAPLPNLPLEMPEVRSPPHPMLRSATSSERTKTESLKGHRTNPHCTLHVPSISDRARDEP
ncbi:hypothetical protein M0R45_014840 [Rubus argutus]|uniref:Uncharacterized protein n=1 Tax=Rubus argutus TaxID=59490 RepID=A0AAW1XP50_RUBAR